MIHTVATKVIRATPERLMALYLDYLDWPRLFPATIRGVSLLGDEGGRTQVEVDHVTEGKVLNTITVISANEVRLDESKPRYEATFMNRFERHPSGARYSIFAEVALKGFALLLTPFAAPVVRSRLHRDVLLPMKARAEEPLPPKGGPGTPLRPQAAPGAA